MKKIAVFVSGGGTNLQQIADYFADNKGVKIACVVSNNKNAYANQRAHNMNIPLIMVDKESFNDEAFTGKMVALGIDLIVLAGFLWLVPQHLINAFPNRIINIHPALLPKFGGKGFYGHHVHEAVIAAGEKESGCTIHIADGGCDTGRILIQKKVPVMPDDTPDTLYARIAPEEHKAIVEGLCLLAKELA